MWCERMRCGSMMQQQHQHHDGKSKCDVVDHRVQNHSYPAMGIKSVHPFIFIIHIVTWPAGAAARRRRRRAEQSKGELARSGTSGSVEMLERQRGLEFRPCHNETCRARRRPKGLGTCHGQRSAVGPRTSAQ
ncbi:hypothetical protein MPTK1_8g07880 [Marchantia polymorpha subsp. ruderalis]|uniref:Uncharacterized protein n=1 Tax=Marchantia polymorpha TaxID=3197 RepID=A0A2R6XI14_MARPO|nr:hypothetical protein MARPO_0013s0007 [Marchantia polymorpha]BBN19104.1 hypothetical protein Mp_8g07880 [Marchantia polymorpha subsp. ruderalis]|eukprot:PTQ45740.1 hypothetical protein MARPO_0013s0007 [Marchantia polymorpha]